MAEDLATLIKTGLKTRFIGREIIYLPSVTSTMDAARDEALNGAAEGTVIIAGEQTAGRGRLKRRWLAPEGNISLSIVLHPDTKNLPYLIMIASLAVVKSIKRTAGAAGQIKWPNDVLIDGKKVCGILIENEMRGNNVAYSVMGIGINVSLKVNDYNEIAQTATSLFADRIVLIRALLEEFDVLYQKLPDGNVIYKDWRNNLVTLGKKVKATWGKQIIEGVAENVDEDGALIIRGEDGTLTKVVAGDVTLQ
ncbi:MAG: biotin--[acetyl-CoA-carboxylase] ligase [Dehalococcoidales bacterium]|nr:biotin--[acetyl-CoA-carboxylase] ligase [Dehalococcoidales bacterium]